MNKEGSQMSMSEVVNAQQPSWQEQIRAKQDQANRAFLNQDVDGLSLILSEDFIVNSPIGRILTKSEMLGLLQRGIIRHFSYEEEIERMVRHGDMVIVMGRDEVTNRPDQPTRRRFTNVWRETAGSWQMVARHAHPIAES